MKYYFHLFAAIIFCIPCIAQNSSISLSGRLNINKRNSAFYLKNVDGVKILVPVNAHNNFLFIIDSLQKGFYEIEEIGTTYLCEGFQLNIQPGERETYIFKGAGSFENNIFRKAKKQISTFFSIDKKKLIGELSQDTYYLTPSVFMQKLDSFQKNGELILDKSTDTFFRKYAALDLEFYCKHLLSLYFLYYGKDISKMIKMPDMVRKLDKKAPNYITLVSDILKSVNVKTMSGNDRRKLTELIFFKWDKDNEILFRNSVYYQKYFENFFTFMAFSPKYSSIGVKGVDPEIKKIRIVKGEIINPYILAYFNYAITSSILKMNKDTILLNKHYNEFLASSPRQDYLRDIKEIYNNFISYSDNLPAPDFAYSNVLGKIITLKSLRGKFVYIDVWATWCSPCKAEITHLKKLEADYHDKNIEFVSISVDEQNTKGKWKEFVIKNKLKGNQLITDNAFETAFIAKMSIHSIPRFILIDPGGKLISADALRPSDKELRILLDKLL